MNFEPGDFVFSVYDDAKGVILVILEEGKYLVDWGNEETVVYREEIY